MRAYFRKRYRTHPPTYDSAKAKLNYDSVKAKINNDKYREMKAWRWYGPYKRYKPRQIEFGERCRVQLRDQIRYSRDYERIRKVKADYRRRNPEILHGIYKRHHQKYGEKIRERQRNYYHAHPFFMRARSANRWARKRDCQGVVTARDIASIYHRQRGLCFYCDIRLDHNFEVDHKMPLSRQGPNIPANLCCTCHDCNQHKMARSAEEFLEERLSKAS